MIHVSDPQSVTDLPFFSSVYICNNALEINTQHYAFLPAEHVRSMAESNGKHAARWYDHLEPRRHMIADSSNEMLNLADSTYRRLGRARSPRSGIF